MICHAMSLSAVLLASLTVEKLEVRYKRLVVEGKVQTPFVHMIMPNIVARCTQYIECLLGNGGQVESHVVSNQPCQWSRNEVEW